MLNYKLFAETMMGLCEMTGASGSKALYEMYYAALKHLTDEDFKEAVNKTVSRITFHKLPLPAELLVNLKGDIENRAICAIDKLDEAIRRIGNYQTVIFDDPFLHAVVEAIGGWIKLGEITEEEWKWIKKDALKLYKAFVAGQGRRPPLRLIGIIEQQARPGDKLPEPVYVGDKVMALEWTNKKIREIEGVSPVRNLLENIGRKEQSDSKN